MSRVKSVQLSPIPSWEQIDNFVAQAIAIERQWWLEEFLPHALAAMQDETAQAIERTKRAATDAIAVAKSQLNVEICEARSAVAELRVALAADRVERAKIIDLPGSPLSPRAKVH